jgi:hypothetical protein
MAAIFHSRLKPKTFTDDKGVNHLNNNKKYLFPFHSAVGTRQRNEFHKLEKFDHDQRQSTLDCRYLTPRQDTLDCRYLTLLCDNLKK